MLLSIGFRPSVLTCGDVEPNPGPRAHSCTIWAISLTHLLTSLLRPPLSGRAAPPPPCGGKTAAAGMLWGHPLAPRANAGDCV